LVAVDWRRGLAVNVGRYPGFGFGAIRLSDYGEVAVVRRRSKDVWLRDGGAGKRMTFDGQNYTAAMSSTGVLLMSKRTDSGVFAIWRQTPDRRLERLTDGPDDVEPSFSKDGKQWTYADYSKMSIMLCSTELGSCRVLHQDGLLPSRPRFSPDGEVIAYVTQLNRPQVTLVSTRDGLVRASWDAHPDCSPAWSSEATVWSLESSNGRYVWSERDLTGKRTGNQFPGSSESLEAGEIQCSPRDVTVESSPWFSRVEIENADTSKILIGSFR
jgi:Tol biopolymer transport system component